MSVTVVPSGDAEYEKLVKEYWTHLLSPNSDNPKQADATFMRANYEYLERWMPGDVISNPPSRRNVNMKHPKPHEIGGADNAISITTSDKIFLPVIDSCLNDFDVDPSGVKLSSAQIEEILKEENDDAEGQLVSGSVPKIHGPGGVEEIVSSGSLKNYREKVIGFSYHVPCDSKLAGKIEFPFPIDKDLILSAEGFYLIFTINSPGKYHVTSQQNGLRGYVTNMEYHFDVS